MRLITMSKKIGEGRLEFFGCPLGCKYCSHRIMEKKDISYDQLLKFLSDYETKRVFIGGAEPALYKKELTDLIRLLSKRGKEITLKTTGYDPSFIKETLGFVNLYLLEIKAPLDDVETTSRLTNMPDDKVKEYLQNLQASLDLLKGQKVRAIIRVIPPMIDGDKIERMGQQLQGKVSEAHLIQFLSSTNDLPFEGIDKPAPPLEEMEHYAALMVKYIPLVKLQADGVETTIRA